MDPTLIALFGFALLFLLLFLRVPVGAAMMIVGALGIWFIRPQASIPVLASEIFGESSNYALTILPLFILMGNLAGVSGMSRDLYNAAYSWLGHLRGGLASATIVGCAGFSALSGSSLAAALTMGRVSLPEMQRYKYDDALSTGSIAAGGTLGILIPPSAGFVIYAILTEESIGQLFMAGVIPGVLLTLLFLLTIRLVLTKDPSKAPRLISAEKSDIRWRMLGKATWIIGIITIAIGGIYFGVFSAIEASGIGAFLALLVAIVRKKLGLANLKFVAIETLKSTGTVFFILFGAFVFKTFIGFTGLAFATSTWIEGQDFSALHVVIAILLMYIILGTFLEGFAIMVLTIPLLQPALEGLGVDLIWFGVLIVITLEMGLISPPVGINVFVVKGIAPNVPINTIFRGIWPFWFAMFIAVFLIITFPDLALFLPDTMFN